MELQLDLFGGSPAKPRSRRGRRRSTTRVPRQKTTTTQAKDIPDSQERSVEVEQLKKQIQSLEEIMTELRDQIMNQQVIKDYYSTREVAALLGKSEYTVREWCREQRMLAKKAMCGRGCELEWRIGHEELTRHKDEGLRPRPQRYARQ